jgi:hypothetical protein
MVASYEESLVCISLPASTDHSSNQYKFVTVNSSGQVALTGNGAEVDGVLQDKPAAANRQASVAISGVTKVLLGTGGVTAGDDVASAASGLCVTAATGDVIVGRALQTGSSGDIVAILLKLGNKAPLA